MTVLVHEATYDSSVVVGMTDVGGWAKSQRADKGLIVEGGLRGLPKVRRHTDEGKGTEAAAK